MLKLKYFSPFTVLSLFAIILIHACVSHDLEAPIEVDCTGFQAVSFDTHVKPIIESNCAIEGDGGCHNGGNGPDLDWNVFSNFHAHASEVRRRVTLPPSHADKMPRIGSLTLDQIELLVCWVEQGAQQN